MFICSGLITDQLIIKVSRSTLVTIFGAIQVRHFLDLFRFGSTATLTYILKYFLPF